MIDDGWEKTDYGWRKVYSGQREPSPHRSNFPTPRVSSDVMPLTEHVDGKRYDSKSQYRAVTKSEGLIEVGNDPARFGDKSRRAPDKQKRADTIKKAVQQVIG